MFVCSECRQQILKEDFFTKDGLCPKCYIEQKNEENKLMLEAQQKVNEQMGKINGQSGAFLPSKVAPHYTPHHDLCNELAELLDKKRADYGSENIKKFGSQGVLVRVSDKVERLINLSHKGGEANFESIEDTWKDIAGYAVLALIELREGR